MSDEDTDSDAWFIAACIIAMVAVVTLGVTVNWWLRV